MMRSHKWFFICLVTIASMLTGCSTWPDMAQYLHQDTVDTPEVSAAELSTPVPDGELIGDVRVACVVLPEESLPASAETVADTQLLTEEVTPPDDIGDAVIPEPVFDLPVVENAKVRYFIDHYTTSNGRRTFTRWLQRSGRYLPMMREIFAREGLPQDLAILAMVESGFNSNAHSWANAVGHWQFIESTGKMFGLENDWWRDERRDVEKATVAAARYLKQLNQRFDGNWYLAVASYNAGPGKISRAVKKYHTDDFWQLCRGDYLHNETKNYVPKLLAALLISKQPSKYGFCDLKYAEPMQFDRVVLLEATDLELVAELTGATYAQLKELNPELKRWCTPPHLHNYTLRVPPGCSSGFAEKYAAIPSSERARYKLHRIKAGDTLQHIARQYAIRVQDIVELNKIKNPRALRIGNNLILPMNRDFSKLPMAELADDYQHLRRSKYTVRSGDSLWSIANKCAVTQKQLRVWNNLGWSDIIQPGKVLLVSAPRGTVSKRAIQQKVVYQVRSGDTLWGIGQRFSVHTKEIKRWNGLAENHILQPGDKLTLLVDEGKHT